MILFFALCFVGIAIAGLTAFVIFWPLSLVHIRDRHPSLQKELGEGAFARPAAWGWLLRRGYLGSGDGNLNGLANPARISLLTIIISLACAGLLWILSELLK